VLASTGVQPYLLKNGGIIFVLRNSDGPKGPITAGSLPVQNKNERSGFSDSNNILHGTNRPVLGRDYRRKRRRHSSNKRSSISANHRG
jgi:hypothetical protein